MKQSIKLLSVVAALAAGTSVFAQQPDSGSLSASSGLLGKRYAEASFSFVDINHSGIDAFGAGLNVNVPLTTSLDLGFGYGHDWIESFSDIDSDVVSADLTGYITSGSFRPFATLALGHAWVPGDDFAVWGAAVGVEYDISSVVSTRLTAGYRDDFESGSNGSWDATARANLWITRGLAANVAVSLIERGDVAYTAGITLRF